MLQFPVGRVDGLYLLFNVLQLHPVACGLYGCLCIHGCTSSLSSLGIFALQLLGCTDTFGQLIPLCLQVDTLGRILSNLVESCLCSSDCYQRIFQSPIRIRCVTDKNAFLRQVLKRIRPLALQCGCCLHSIIHRTGNIS